MKRVITALLCSLLVFSLFAKTNKKDDGALKARVEQIIDEAKNVKGNRGDIWVKDVSSSNETYSSLNFYASSAFLALDKFFNFSKILTDEQLLQLGKALYKTIPVDENASELRVIVVTKYFEDDSNLVLQIFNRKLKIGSIPGKEYGYRFTANVKSQKTQNKKTGEKTLVKTKEIFDEKDGFNLIYIPYENGKLVRSREVNLGTKIYDENMSATKKVDLVDKFLFDEIEANDNQIEKLYNEINKSDADDWNKFIINPLNYGLYLTKLGKYDEAEKLWKNIDAQKVPEDKKNFYNYIISYDIPFRVKVMKGL
ncbi:MAG: hypothetical protein K5640_00435 [Treponema sp.]|nr:hypothetical protein [Treponema sp.]